MLARVRHGVLLQSRMQGSSVKQRSMRSLAMGARGDTRKRRKLKARLAVSEHECWLCLGYYGPLDFSLPYLHPFAVEIDEEVPFSKGGDPNDPRGTHLVHRFCNLKKGSKILPRGAFSEGIEASGVNGRRAASEGFAKKSEKPSPSRAW